LFRLAAMTVVPPSQLPAVIGAWGIAFLAGFVAPVLPAGLGVREVTAAAVLTTLVPAPMAVAAALLFRLVLTATELICVACCAITSVRGLRRA